jgi:hypothetical protein
VTNEKAQVVVALGALVVAVVACKHTYTPPGTVVVDASVVDVMEERAESASGACDPTAKKFRCLAHDKVAWCKTHNEGGGRHPKEVGEWRTMDCEGCDDSGSWLSCTTYPNGDACNTFIMKDRCTKDGLAHFVCDPMTSTWKIDACPGGCTQDAAFHDCRK